MEDNLNFLVNGRRHQFFCKWKMTSTILQMEDDLKFACTWKTNGRRPQLFCKWKINGKQPEFILKNLKTTESFQMLETILRDRRILNGRLRELAG